MPRRSERERYLDRMKGGNPFAGKSARAMYRGLRWGNAPNAEHQIEAPENLVAIGELARLDFVDGRREEYAEDEAPFLAVGHRSNLVYIVPRDSRGNPIDVPPVDASWRPVGRVTRTDYYSDKGGDAAYYYHDHENPYPVLYECEQTGCGVYMPANWRGGRSYVVSDEGIIG